MKVTKKFIQIVAVPSDGGTEMYGLDLGGRVWYFSGCAWKAAKGGDPDSGWLQVPNNVKEIKSGKTT